ncbi:hypothetical protein Golob_023848 [Gossypium lobatum]|uniref:DUF4283 domain-containing protein n=1 Tax=Gossypium lobatum TaxID=34289 RepID=A0A7J8NH22_9ROSI|nr:hypothetical protein [Gossypium lobatum]
MRTVMTDLWHPLGGVSIADVGEKRFLFQFYCEMDFDRVVKGAPWTFNNHLLVFHHLKQGEDPLEVDLLYTEFWVQIYNLPSGFFTESIAKQFGDFIGVFVEYDTKAIAAGLRSYMRIRVKVDIRQSLKRRKKLIVAKKEFFVTFKYERLSTFCFLCGKLRHSENCCPIRMVTARKELPLEWDISLKAPPRKQEKNLGELNLIRNYRVNLGLNLLGKSKQIVDEELVLMEDGPTEEDRPITGGEGKRGLDPIMF